MSTLNKLISFYYNTTWRVNLWEDWGMAFWQKVISSWPSTQKPPFTSSRSSSKCRMSSKNCPSFQFLNLHSFYSIQVIFNHTKNSLILIKLQFIPIPIKHDMIFLQVRLVKMVNEASANIPGWDKLNSWDVR